MAFNNYRKGLNVSHHLNMLSTEKIEYKLERMLYFGPIDTKLMNIILGILKSRGYVKGEADDLWFERKEI